MLGEWRWILEQHHWYAKKLKTSLLFATNKLNGSYNSDDPKKVYLSNINLSLT
jgi:hypothetical protein